MSRKYFATGVALIIMLFVTSVVGAQGLPDSGWYSSVVIQNVGATAIEANGARIDVYTSSATPSSVTFGLAVGQSRTFIAGSNGQGGNLDVSPPLPSGTSGSAVISAPQPIVAIGSIQNNQIPGISGPGVLGGNANGQFRGASQGSTSIFYPVVKNNYVNRKTVFSIQAVGGDATITASIRSSTGQTYNFGPTTITANRSIILDPSSFSPPMPSTNCGNDTATSPCFGALTVTASSGQIAGTYIEFQVGESPAQIVLAASMLSADEADDQIYCPNIKNEYVNRSTGMSVFNTSTSPVRVDVTYKVIDGPNVGATYTRNDVEIPARSSVVFSRFNAGTLGGMPNGNLASATVKLRGSTDDVLLAVVNEANLLDNQRVRATAYTCFSAKSATAKIAAPIFKRNLAGVTSGLVVQNVSDQAFPLRATFTCGTTTPTTVTINTPAPVAPGASYLFSGFVRDDNRILMQNVPFGQLCSVIVTGGDGSNPNYKIVGIAQETAQFGTAQPNLDNKNYEAFNLP